MGGKVGEKIGVLKYRSVGKDGKKMEKDFSLRQTV
jgi:hypothetical protein